MDAINQMFKGHASNHKIRSNLSLMYVEELCLTTVNKMIKDNFITLKGHLKPSLSEKQMIKRLEIVLGEVGNDLKC
jgi:hypothetical protein